MRKLTFTGQFKKDVKLGKKRHYDMAKLEEIIRKLVNCEVLEARFEDHPLQGKYSDARDCHIAPDWILIYLIVGDELRLIRTGTHSDLYK